MYKKCRIPKLINMPKNKKIRKIKNSGCAASSPMPSNDNGVISFIKTY